MRCNKVKKMLGAYLDGELSEREAKRIQQHIAMCSACAWEMKSLQRIDELGRWAAESGSPQLPEGYWESFLVNLHERKGTRQQYDTVSFFSLCWRFPVAFAWRWFKKTAIVLTAIVAIAALIMGIGYVRRQPLKTTKLEEEKITINFYLKEHENAVIQASYSTQPARREIELGYEDVFYYGAARGMGREWPGETGVFLRAPRRGGGVLQYAPTMREEPSRATDIANGHNLSLQKAQKAVSFKIVAPQTLYPGYFLETIRKIEGKGCLQLIYTNGISTLSLFEQAIESEEKFHSDDFKEYVIYSRGGSEPVNIIGWNSAEVSFTLIGEEDFSYLMSVIRALQRGYLEESGLGNKD